MNTLVNQADFQGDAGEKVEICQKPLNFDSIYFYTFLDTFFVFVLLLFLCMLAMPTYKAKGVQTDKDDSTRLTVNNNLSAHDHLSNKLLTVWSSQSGQISGKNLVSKLLVACETDFHVLFGHLSMNMASKMINCLADVDSFDLALKGHITSAPFEVAKVSHLYSVLVKVLS